MKIYKNLENLEKNFIVKIFKAKALNFYYSKNF